MNVPNLLHIVEDCKERFPVEWSNAHSGNAHSDDFIKIVAAECHKEDIRFGNNGKRGDPHDMSDDALNFLHPEGPDFDPTRGGLKCYVIDVIGSAGSTDPNKPPFPQWVIVSDPAKPVGAAWIEPGEVVEPEPEPPPHVCFVPEYEKDLGGDAWFRANIGVPLQADMALAGQACLNDGSSVWFSRSIHEIMAACVKAGKMIDRAPIVTKYRNQWRTILGLPPL